MTDLPSISMNAIASASAIPPATHRASLGITLRTALLSWLVTVSTLLIFIAVIIPQQKTTFLQNLESKANGTAVSLREVAAGAAVNEDFSTVVDHGSEILAGDSSVDYLVVTKNDGFSIIIERNQWRSEPLGSPRWRPAKREPTGGIDSIPPLDRRVYHYSQPFDYSGIEWGWIHVGLSLQSYDRSVAAVYQRTWLLAILCIGISLVASAAYARRLVRPILHLRGVVRRVADGDLTAHAQVEAADELGNLADSVNSMTQALLRRDRILHSVRFAAQQFLACAKWDDVIEEVLAHVGEAATACRVRVLENQADDGQVRSIERFVWSAPKAPAVSQDPSLHRLEWHLPALAAWSESIRHSEFVSVSARNWSPGERAILEPRGIRSFLLIPVRVENAWWGLLALEDCREDRVWSEAERDSLRAAADILGARIARQRTQDALVRAKEAAEAASTAKSQFLANMSHEIRTPITGVMGMLQLLQRTALDEKQRRYVANTVSSADALLKVIGDILDFSKIEAGKLALESISFSIPDTLDAPVRLLAGQIENKGLELSVDIADDVPRHVVGDPHRLQQVLLNLLSNAVKFTDRGIISLSCTLVEATSSNTTLRFEVRDTGTGIAPEQQSLIFDAFCQADNSMSRAHGGTGLGLTISRQLTRLMGGSIGVQSALGQGSTFWFTATFDLAAPPERKAVDFRGLRVLVVDDCNIVRRVVSEYVRGWKGLPAEASDAASALETLRSAAADGRPFAVAILDWRMPGIDGLDLARLIRQDPVLKAIGLVLLSSFAQKNMPPQSETADLAAILSKPARRSELYDAIVRAANGHLVHLAPKIPLAAPKIPAPPLPLSPAGSILLAEDNDINQEVACEMLAGLGHRVTRVRNGREALETAATSTFDLILMDCQMPEMDGYEATRRIRERETSTPPREPGSRHVPIIALTAHAMTGDRDRCLQAGMDDYLTKPLEPEALARCLSSWIPVRPGPITPPSETPAAKPSPTAGSQPNLEPRPVPALANTLASGTMKDSAATTTESAGTGAPPALPPPPPPPPIDHSSLVHRCMGNLELANRLVRKFTTQARGDLIDLEAALGQNDAPRVRQIAHRLKGSAANVSAEAIRSAAAILENLGRDAALHDAPPALAALKSGFEALARYDSPGATS